MVNPFKIRKKQLLFLVFLSGGWVVAIAIFTGVHGVNQTTPVPPHPSPAKVPVMPSPLPNLATQWVISPKQAQGFIQKGAVILDARGSTWLPMPSIKGAIRVSWQQFSRSDPPNQGQLLENEAILTQKLREVGIFQHKAVIVFADPLRGWGEEGRIVWMLRTLGHQQAALVDGGYGAMIKAGIASGQAGQKAPQPGDFQIHRTTTWEIGRQGVQTQRNNGDGVLLDVREAREFQGETPYGERRKGHIPGAIHLYYRDLMDQKGNILPHLAIVEKLKTLGISRDRQIVAYCTAGVRAGWVTSVLSNSGFNIRNYAGSMLDWSSASAIAYPLIQSPSKPMK